MGDAAFLCLSAVLPTGIVLLLLAVLLDETQGMVVELRALLLLVGFCMCCFSTVVCGLLRYFYFIDVEEEQAKCRQARKQHEKQRKRRAKARLKKARVHVTIPGYSDVILPTQVADVDEGSEGEEADEAGDPATLGF